MSASKIDMNETAKTLFNYDFHGKYLIILFDIGSNKVYEYLPSIFYLTALKGLPRNLNCR